MQRLVRALSNVLSAMCFGCAAGAIDTGGPTTEEPAPEEPGSTTSTPGTSLDGTTAGEPDAPQRTPWGDYALAECEALHACTCADPVGLAEDRDACVALRHEQLASLAATGLYQWNADCAELRLQQIEGNCASGAQSCEAERCALFTGNRGEWSSCDEVLGLLGFPDASACASGLGCFPSWGVCLYTCPPADDPRPEVVECGEHMCLATECYCNPGGHFCKCKPDGGPGEPCGPPMCAPGSFCNAEHLCEAKRPPGAYCETGEECQLEHCDDNDCADLAGEHEACWAVDCADGLVCDPDAYYCKRPGHLGDSCFDKVCEDGLTCSWAGLCEPLYCEVYG
jgi:hypothetical protein